MYHGGKTQPNQTLAGLQRTFYPKYVSYFGDGSGRDAFIVQNNGTLCVPIKKGMGHTGVHLQKYNSTVARRRSISPHKDATTFYYQSDGSGRDGYVLKDNGGLRATYNNRLNGDNVFRDSLRSDRKSPLRHFQDPVHDKGDITTYLNWKSAQGKHLN